MMRFDIDLQIEHVGPEIAPATQLSIRAAGGEVVVTIEDVAGFRRWARRDLTQLVPLANALARRGIRVRIESPQGTLAQIGDVKSGPVTRVIAGSPHIKLGRLGVLLAELRRREHGSEPAVPLPPLPLLPLLPPVMRGPHRDVTTTHYVPGSGRPRLIFAVGSGDWDSSRPREFNLLPGRTVIGSGPDADLRLTGLSTRHAEIRQSDDDEYVLYSFAATGGGRPNLPHSTEDARILRTGSRIEIGPWRLAYYREEFADHGRPFGGRQGGEYAFQRQQAVRPYGSGELG